MLPFWKCHAYLRYVFVPEGDTWEWGSCMVLRSGVFCLWSHCICRFRWCKICWDSFKLQTQHSSVHAWPFIILLTTPNQMYFLVIIISMERAGRFDLRRILFCLDYKFLLMSGTVHVMAYEDRVKFPGHSLILGVCWEQGYGRAGLEVRRMKFYGVKF